MSNSVQLLEVGTLKLINVSRQLLSQNQIVSFEGLPYQPWHYLSTCT